jgi:hypothetical protein
MVKETCNGILKEGGLLGDEKTALKLCKQIQCLKDEDWNGLCKAVIQMYTQGTFLYRALNKALREEDMTKI